MPVISRHKKKTKKVKNKNKKNLNLDSRFPKEDNLNIIFFYHLFGVVLCQTMTAVPRHCL